MLRYLGERFEVELICPALDGMVEAGCLLKESCVAMEFVPPSDRSPLRRSFRLGPYEIDPQLGSAIRRRLAFGGYDAVQVEKPAMLPYLPSRMKRPVVLDTFAYGLTGAMRALRYESGLVRRARNLLRLIRFAAFDAFCWPATYCILVVSEIDRQRCLRERPGRKVLVVPNGVDCTAIRPGSCPAEGRPVLLFTGDMAFDPNVQAARILALRIFPRVRQAFPAAELRLVGRNPRPDVLGLRAPGVSVVGDVPEMLPHLRDATVYAAPLVTGAGTRTKLLEAMAAGLPIVTTSTGLEGIEATDGLEVRVAEDPEAMVAAVVDLLKNPQERARLGNAARRLAEDRYDWSRCLAPLASMYSEMLPARAR
jgi:glycosyltransferase involved in cell wall biosynthesis